MTTMKINEYTHSNLSNNHNRFKTINLIILALGINTFIWGVTLSYLKNAPKKFTTTWTMILQSKGTTSSVNLDTLGQATTEAPSAYGNTTVDPRADYKSIALGSEVVNIASSFTRRPASDFSGFKVKPIDPTSTLEFSVSGSSPEDARDKAIALNAAFNIRLDQLRKEDLSLRQGQIQEAVNNSRSTLGNAQQALSNFKRNMGFVDNTQVVLLLNNLEQLKQQYINVEAQRQQQSSALNSLQQNLKFTPNKVVDTFSIQNDKTIQQNLVTLGEVRNQIALQSATLVDNHPTMITLREKEANLLNSTTTRASSLLGKSVSEGELQQLLRATGAGAGDGGQALYNNLITSVAEVKGLDAQSKSLYAQIVKTESRINQLSVQQPVLLGLERDVKLAEVVYTSSVGRLDLIKSDLYSAFPIVQLLSAPDLASKPSSPKTELIYLGSGIASVISTTALGLLWLRSQSSKKREREYA